MTRSVRPPGRERMVATAARLFGRQGVDGTSFSHILTESGAPRGSIYYYFPAGKQELVVDAVRWTTEAVLAYQRTSRARTPSDVVHHFVAFFHQGLQHSSCRDGCPLAAVAVGSYGSTEVLRESVRPGFRAWTSLLTTQLETAGLARSAARRLAVTTVASVEGALLLARAEGSLGPLEEVDEQLQVLAASAGAGGSAPRRAGRRGPVQPRRRA